MNSIWTQPPEETGGKHPPPPSLAYHTHVNTKMKYEEQYFNLPPNPPTPQSHRNRRFQTKPVTTYGAMRRSPWQDVKTADAMILNGDTGEGIEGGM